MKKVIYWAMLILGMTMLSSCSKDKDNGNDDFSFKGKSIVGVWVKTSHEIFKDKKWEDNTAKEYTYKYTFNSDGTGNYYMSEKGGVTIDIVKYKIEGDVLWITFRDEGGGTYQEDKKILELSSDMMKWEYQAAYKCRADYRRVK